MSRGLCALVAAVVVPVPALAAPPGEAPPRPGPGTAATQAEVPDSGRGDVAPEERDRVLGAGWQRSGDRAWTTSGDPDGFHVLVADAATGYAWRTAATLSEPGFAADRWIGNACVTGDGSRAVVAYAPRTFTNEEALFERGAFTAVVDLNTGAVRKLPLTSTMAYFSPSCGVGQEALITQDGGQEHAATRVVSVDAASGALGAPIEVAGQLTSAVPTPNGIVAADNGMLVRVAPDGTRTLLTPTSGVPFEVHADADGGVVYMERHGAATARSGAPSAQVRRVDAAGIAAPARVASTLVAGGRLDAVGVVTGGAGRVFVTGAATAAPGARSMPGSVQVIEAPKDTEISVLGEVLLTGVDVAAQGAPGAAGDPTVLVRPVSIDLTARKTGARAEFSVLPTGDVDPAGRDVHPALDRGGAPDGEVGVMASPTDPADSADRYCSVPRNDPRNQAMQPKPRQVEWAVNQAITNSLYTQRPANWKNLGMSAYTPQGLFPPRALAGGGRVPAQIFLGIIAQESNMWQAPGHVMPGVTGNPLIGNYYGLDISASGNAAWDVRFDKADCGYGVTQITDGMRLAGKTKPGETALPYNTQRAAALDFAANVAGGLQILQDKWNQTRNAGLVVNNGDPLKIENWFFAVWAYNSGFYPQSTSGQHNGAWGVGWLNNPANPIYPANRRPFLNDTYADAANPQRWPYPEKVMGWAGHPVEVLESPGTLVSGYRQASWNGGDVDGPRNRERVKPPVNQFCNTTNNCVPGASYTPNAPDVIGSPAGPCAHRDSAGRYDLKCWFNKPSTWKSDCSFSCGVELLRFSPGYAYQEDGTPYPPNCGRTGLPSSALIIDNVAQSVPSVRPGCSKPASNGTFGLSFNSDANGDRPGKIDFHQIGGGFGGHFWLARTRVAEVRGNSMQVSGTWTLDRSLTQWARVFVHMPDHGAHTQQARYDINLGNGTRHRVTLQRTMSNRWVSLGVMPFNGTPRITLTSTTKDGDDGVKPIEAEAVAFDAVAIQPIGDKPDQVVVSLGDSYSSGEGASNTNGADYYPETDNNGDRPTARNACHRSPYAWSRGGLLTSSMGTFGQRTDQFDANFDHQLIACSGAQTEQLLPFHSSATKPTNAFGQQGRGQYGELSQLDRGYLTEDTTLVTVSVGGNDARFADVIAECILYAGLVKCQDAKLPDSDITAGEEVPALIRGPVEDSIVTALIEIRRKAPNAKIVLMGYPPLFEGTGGCVPGIGTGETPWLNEMSTLLAQHMGEAAARANTAAGRQFVWYSNPTSEFAGEAVCGDPETIHGIVTSKTPGDEPGLKPSAQSFHPKINGAQNYADALNRTLRTMGL